MNLVVDIGNTRSKLGLFKGKEAQQIDLVSHDDLLPFITSLRKRASLEHIAFANVGDPSLNLALNIGDIPVFEVNARTPVPLGSSYATPGSLGIDRLCAAVAAHQRFPDSPTLSIDLGTCITYDLVVEGNYKGGGISPGLNMRFQAMHQFTQRLPYVSDQSIPSSLGNTTQTSLQFGAGYGMLQEVNGMIAHFRGLHPKLKVILTGGDHSTFEQLIENPIFAAPNLVLEGINEILLYNLEEKIE